MNHQTMEEKKVYGRPEAEPVNVVIEPVFNATGENVGGKTPAPGEIETP